MQHLKHPFPEETKLIIKQNLNSSSVGPKMVTILGKLANSDQIAAEEVVRLLSNLLMNIEDIGIIDSALKAIGDISQKIKFEHTVFNYLEEFLCLKTERMKQSIPIFTL